MELEEMKERWAALNDRLERTEMLQESVIRELEMCIRDRPRAS